MYPGVGGALLLPLFLLAVRMCVVCGAKPGEGGEIEGLVPIVLPARPVRWVSPMPCTAYSATAGLICYPNAGSHYVRAPLNPVLVACHRFKKRY